MMTIGGATRLRTARINTSGTKQMMETVMAGLSSGPEDRKRKENDYDTRIFIKRYNFPSNIDPISTTWVFAPTLGTFFLSSLSSPMIWVAWKQNFSLMVRVWASESQQRTVNHLLIQRTSTMWLFCVNITLFDLDFYEQFVSINNFNYLFWQAL